MKFVINWATLRRLCIDNLRLRQNLKFLIYSQFKNIMNHTVYRVYVCIIYTKPLMTVSLSVISVLLLRELGYWRVLLRPVLNYSSVYSNSTKRFLFTYSLNNLSWPVTSRYEFDTGRTDNTDDKIKPLPQSFLFVMTAQSFLKFLYSFPKFNTIF